MPNPFQPMIGRRLPGGDPATSLRPPWPWKLRRFGEEPEDWAGDGYSSYYGLEFATELHFPCDGVCDFVRGSTWKLEGSASCDVDVEQRTSPGVYDPQTYSLSKSVTGTREAELGQSVEFFEDYIFGPSSAATGTAWSALNSIYELGALPGDAMVSLYFQDTFLVTHAAPHTADFPLIFSAAATAYLPEIGKNEAGDLVWRIKLVGGVGFSVTHSDLPPLASEYISNPSAVQDVGLEFVDADIGSNSGVITASASGFSLKLTCTRA